MQRGRAFGPTTSGNRLATIVEILEVDIPTAKVIFQKLCKERFIELAGNQASSDGEGECRWYTTIKGNALANASARRPITRETAERVITQLLERIQQVNAGEYAYRVKRAILFGSYLSESLTLGDVDISLELEDRYQDSASRKKGHAARIAAAEESGRQFGDYMDILMWPKQEVLLLLKNRSPSLSLHDEEIEQVLQRPIPSKIFYEADESFP